jgi:uncharacterized protein (DUF362 family)/Pyruvate/2-oxoacid:ferredoxin oxidoreductase delta subunit
MSDLRVAIDGCGGYEEKNIAVILDAQFQSLDLDLSQFRGKKVLVKPNLVIRYDSSRAATTHEAVVEAAAELLVRAGAQVSIADSPGGIWSEAALRSLYRATGMEGAAERSGAALSYDTTYRTVAYPEGKMSREFNVISAAWDADVIFDVCKLKTHTLAEMSNAVKNFFGTVPGVQKFSVHARYGDHRERFFAALNDLCEMFCSHKTVIAVCDAVVGMEGNGPTGGRPRAIGCLLSSRDPFALDLAASRIINAGDTPMLRDAQRRGLCPAQVSQLDFVRDSYEKYVVADYVHADSYMAKAFDLIPPFLAPRPEIDRSECVGCGECVRNCPAQAMTLVTEGGKWRAKIDYGACIRCFCCQELCTHCAVEIKKNFVYRLLTGNGVK